MSIAPIQILFGLLRVAVLRNATTGGGDIVVYSTVASYPRPRVMWASDTGEFGPVD